MKTIIVQWHKEKETGYDQGMYVVTSTHPRFIANSRFDYGFFNIATREGYTIISLPMATADSLPSPTTE